MTTMTQPPPQPDDHQQWLLHGDLPCLGCQYNLRGLVGPVIKCPECGHANDLRDPGPWRKKDLPTGVLVREHWPASAALASLLTLVFGLWTLTWLWNIGLGTIVAGGLFLLAGASWLTASLRWLRSCQNKLWGWSVLVGTHLAMWGILLGAVVPMALVSGRQASFVALSLAAVVLVASVVAFFYLRRIIRNADRTGAFRSDWRQWQLPAGDAAPD